MILNDRSRGAMGSTFASMDVLKQAEGKVYRDMVLVRQPAPILMLPPTHCAAHESPS